jgi:hypothetical protein
VFKSDVYGRLDSIENIQQDRMVQWVQCFGVASTFADVDHDDGPSQGDEGDDSDVTDAMDE